ncbi:unnamed protein product [Cochlearia groenlandica]
MDNDEVPMHQDVIGGTIIPTNQSREDVFLVDPDNQVVEDIVDDEDDGGADEFDETSEVESVDSDNNN